MPTKVELCVLRFALSIQHERIIDDIRWIHGETGHMYGLSGSKSQAGIFSLAGHMGQWPFAIQSGIIDVRSNNSM